MKSYDLAVVAFAVFAVYCVAEGLSQLSWMVLDWDSRYGWNGITMMGPGVVAVLVGLGFFAARGWLARRLFPHAEEELSGVDLVHVQAVGMSLVAVWLALDGGWQIVRVVLPFLFYGDRDSAPWGDLVPDLVTVVLAVWLFFKAEVLVRLWGKVRPAE